MFYDHSYHNGTRAAHSVESYDSTVDYQEESSVPILGSSTRPDGVSLSKTVKNVDAKSHKSEKTCRKLKDKEAHDLKPTISSPSAHCLPTIYSSSKNVLSC